MVRVLVRPYASVGSVDFFLTTDWRETVSTQPTGYVCEQQSFTTLQWNSYLSVAPPLLSPDWSVRS